MIHAAIETTPDKHVRLTLHPSAKEAEDYAVTIAKENTAYTDEEIRSHLRQSDRHEEGDWSVILATGIEKPTRKA